MAYQRKYSLRGIQQCRTFHNREAPPLELPEVLEGINDNKNKEDYIAKALSTLDLFSSSRCLFLMRLLLSRASRRFDNRIRVSVSQTTMSIAKLFKKGGSLERKITIVSKMTRFFSPYLFLSKKLSR